MTSEPTNDDQRRQQPDAGTREVLDEAREAVDLPHGATPDTPQRRASSEHLDEAETDADERARRD